METPVATRYMLAVFVSFLATISLACASSSKRVVPFAEFKRLKPGDENSVRVHGVFDAKSICLNFNPHYVVNGDCKAYFSQSAGPNAPTRELSLNVCANGVLANCIDPLLENAPPEVIVIRDSSGQPLKPWGIVEVEARISAADRLTGIEIVKIETTSSF